MNKAAILTVSFLLVASTLSGPTLAATAGAAPVQEISKEQAVEMALQAHPGKVTKAYQDTRKGKKTWEVQINGSDGKKWEVHYEISSGALVSDEAR